MDLNARELAAVASPPEVGGQPADLLDRSGRLVVTPHPVLTDGQTNVPADLQPGESLAAFLGRHVPGIASGAWSVSISGHLVPQAMWAHTFPKHGQLISCRASVGKSALAFLAIAALAYFTLGAGATLGGSLLGINGVAAVGSMGLLAVNAAIYIAGSMLINKVLGPKASSGSSSSGTSSTVYSISSQRNSSRQYEPFGTLFGEMRVTPDLASAPYTWFEGDDQYLSTILLGGINVHSAADVSVGETSLSDYSDVTTYYNGFSGMPSVDVPLYSNADSLAGGILEDTTAWVVRTSSAGAIVLQLDLEYQLFHQGGGGLENASATIQAEYHVVGDDSVWHPFFEGGNTVFLNNNTTESRRQTYSLPVASGQYVVRMRRTDGPNDDRTTRTLQWTYLRTVQPDGTDYSQWGRLGIKIRASGQISGSLDTLRVTYRARPIPLWNGTAWVNATTREEGLSNCGAVILQVLRGIYAGGHLQFGYGLSDEQIDIEGLKAFMLHCTANGFNYDNWITSATSLGSILDEIALAGMGQFQWLDGSRPTVAWAADGQPISGVVNMANMLRGSFSVNYQLSAAADGIEYQYLDRNKSWETVTLRVAAPGVTTALNPARISGPGITTEAHAALMARYHLAQSLYQFKEIGYSADIESLDYRRMAMLSLSHDMTQWAYGGRLAGAAIVGGSIVLQLDEPVPALATRYVGLRVPGERDYRTFAVAAFEGESTQLTLVGAWPEGVAFPGNNADNPAHDTLWCYDFKATPGYRVRVVSIEPEADLKGASVSVVPEGEEFWNYVRTGTYVPAPVRPTPPQLGRPVASNVRVAEQVNVQGNTQWYELNVVWDVDGAYDHAQVWAGIDGQQLRMVDANAQGARSTFRIEAGGNWLIEVRPFNPGGQLGTIGSVLYITSQVDIPPWNVDQFGVQEIEGGLRRITWAYSVSRPATLAGVQVRYRAGSAPVAVTDWDAMAPIGGAADIYTAHFETTHPDAGLWTFACRAIDTSGRLAEGVKTYTINLTSQFGEIQAPDLTPPPTPTGFAVSAAISNILLEHDAPTYTQGHGHLRTRLYGKAWTSGALPTFADAEELTQFTGTVAAYATNPATTWHLWIKWETADGVLSVTPAGGTNGLAVTTGQDVTALVAAMTGAGKPFTVLTAPTVIDGVTYPAGIYSQAAFLLDLQVTNGKIANLAVDNAKIASMSVAKLTAGAFAVGQYAQSTSFVSGSAGWRWNADGSAELQNAVVRGAIYAASGTFTGTLSSSTFNGGTINSTTINSAVVNGTTINGSTFNGMTMNTGVLNIQSDGGGGWGYARSYGKWWNDGVNGWVLGRAATGETLVEIKTGVSRLWMSSWGDCGISFPGITMNNGGLTIDQLNVIKTANISANAVTVMNSVSGSSNTISTSLYIPPNESMRIVAIGFNEGTGSGWVGAALVSLTIDGSVVSAWMGVTDSGGSSPGYSAATVVHQRDIAGGSSGRTITISFDKNPVVSGASRLAAFGTLR